MYTILLITVVTVTSSSGQLQTCFDFCNSLLSANTDVSRLPDCNCFSEEILDNPGSKSWSVVRPILPLDERGIYLGPVKRYFFDGTLLDEKPYYLNQAYETNFEVSTPSTIDKSFKRRTIITPDGDSDHRNTHFDKQKTKAFRKHNIVQENVNTATKQHPLYLDIDFNDSFDIKRTSHETVSNIEDILLSEKSLIECINPHILVYLTKNENIKLKKKWDTKRSKKFVNLTDSEIINEIHIKCRKPTQVIKQSLQDIIEKRPKKNKTAFKFNTNQHEKSRLAINSLESNHQQKQMNLIRLHNIDSSVTNNSNLANASVSTVPDVIGSTNVDKVDGWTTRNNLKNKINEVETTHAVLNLSDHSENSNKILSNSSTISLDLNSKNNAPSNYTKSPDGINVPTETTNTLVEDVYETRTIDLITKSELYNSSLSIQNTSDGINFDLEQLLTKTNETINENEEKIITYSIFNPVSPVNSSESHLTTTILPEYDESNDQGAEISMNRNENANSNVFKEVTFNNAGITNTFMYDVNRPVYLETEIKIPKIVSKELLDSVISEVNGIEQLPNNDYTNVDNVSQILRQNYTDNMLVQRNTSANKTFSDIEKNLLSELDYDAANNTYFDVNENMTSDGGNSSANKTSADFKSFTTERVNSPPNKTAVIKDDMTFRRENSPDIIGNLYFSFDKNQIPARFIQKPDGKIYIGMDGMSLCDKINSLGNTNLFISAICNCVESGNCKQ